MTESLIEQYLKKILEAVYGKDVRQSIHDAIQQCYFDGKAGSTDLEARQQIEDNNSAVNERIDEVIADILELQETGATAEVIEAKVTSVINELVADGTIANLTIADESVTKEKLSADVIEEINSAGYVVGADGNKYSVSVDESGAVTATRIYELPTDGLICDLQIKNGVVTEMVNAVAMENYTVEDDGVHFTGDFKRYSSATSAYDLLNGETLNDYTVVAYLTDDGSYDGQILAGKSNNDGICLTPTSLKYFNYILPTGSDTTIGFSHKNKFYTSSRIAKSNLIKKGADAVIAFGKNSDSMLIRTMINGVMDETTYTVENSGLYNLRLNNVSKFIRVAVYNRTLTDEEMKEAYNSFQYVDETKYVPSFYAQGLKGLGCPNAFYAKNNECPEWDDSVTDFTEIEQTEATVEEDMTSFTDLFFINPISEIEIGKMYNIEAMVYPYNVLTTSYNVEYSTSDDSILECYAGVLIPKAVGTATITAKISNTEITAVQEINVIEAVTVEENYCYLSEGYCYGVHALNSKNPVSVLKAIIGAIEEVSGAGFNGIVFPKMEYHIKPFQHEVHCTIPTDFTIDFQYSSMYVEDNEFCTSEINKGYSLFEFGHYDFNADPMRIPCHNSTFKNLYFYGERWSAEHENSYYTEFITAFEFATADVYNCHLENVIFNSTVGFNIGYNQNGFQQWQGTSKDGAVRGCVRYTDFSAGKLAEDGVTVEENDGWYCTPEYLKLGFFYDATDYTGMKKYKVGRMNTATDYGLASRWYEIFFFDEEKNLIDYRPHQMTLETYDLPENTVYFKVNAMFTSAPTASDEGKVDVPHVIRLWTSADPDQCYISNCKFINPHASAISITGGTNCVIRNCYAEQGAVFANPNGAMFGWSIDYEDGWQAMRHNILYKTMCSGYLVMPGGHDTAIVNCVIKRMTNGSEQELAKVINSAVAEVVLGSKTNNRLENVTYGSLNTSSKHTSVATTRIINCNSGSVGTLF